MALCYNCCHRDGLSGVAWELHLERLPRLYSLWNDDLQLDTPRRLDR